MVFNFIKRVTLSIQFLIFCYFFRESMSFNFLINTMTSIKFFSQKRVSFIAKPMGVIFSGKEIGICRSKVVFPSRNIQSHRLHSLASEYDESNSMLEHLDKKVLDETNWRDHPSLSETYQIPTIIVPSENVHHMLSSSKERGILVPYLASHIEQFESIHPRIKVVRDLNKIDLNGTDFDPNDTSMKAILLDPEKVGVGEMKLTEVRKHMDHSDTRITLESLKSAFPDLDQSVMESLAKKGAKPGPCVPISLTYMQQTVQSILSKVLPAEVLPPPTGFEQIGHVIHLNLKDNHLPYKRLIGSVILDRLGPKIETVVNKVGEVSGPYRTYDMELLAGKPDTVVKLVEDGVSLEFDLKKVYWCTRLSGERSRLLEEFNSGETIADAFCGVGSLCVLAASKLGCTIYANDLNPDAVKYCRDNAKRNLKRFPVEDRPMFHVECGDAFDFIQGLGNLPTLPHHVVMNFPLDSPSFLGALRWWPSSASKRKKQTVIPTVHLYTFARGDDPNDDDDNNNNSNDSSGMPPRNATEVAVDLVAEGLIPEGGAIQSTRYRRAMLDKMGCNVRTREVRDVAPGKVVICVSFQVTDTLLSIMQGEFLDI
jgi:tRNA (guanine37-N1)-methyltransferase